MGVAQQRHLSKGENYPQGLERCRVWRKASRVSSRQLPSIPGTKELENLPKIPAEWAWIKT